METSMAPIKIEVDLETEETAKYENELPEYEETDTVTQLTQVDVLNMFEVDYMEPTQLVAFTQCGWKTWYPFFASVYS